MSPRLLFDTDIAKRAEVIRLLNLGYTTRSIGAAVGCSHNTIRLFALANNIPIGNVKERHRAAAKDLILNSKLTVQEAAKTLNLKVATIYTYLKDDPQVLATRRAIGAERAEARRQKRNATRNAKREAERAQRASRPEPEPKPRPTKPPDIHFAFNHTPHRLPLPPIDPTTAQALINQFIENRGTTKCPTMFAAPTQAYRA